MKNVLIVDSTLDNMGGVERIVNTLANSFVDFYNVSVLSIYNTRNEPFYEYDDKVNKFYLCKRFNSFKRKKNFLHYFLRFFEKINEEFSIVFMNKSLKNVFLSSDVIIFGRVDSALKFLPFIKKNNIKAKVIVRDAIHLFYQSNSIKAKMKNFFPYYVSNFIVSSDESINEYYNFFGKCDSLSISKIYNPLGINSCNCFNDNHNIVSLGRLDSQKGFENLIMAFKNIVSIYDDWTLEIYGDGPEKNFLTNVIEENNLSNNVFIRPPQKDVEKIFSKGSIYVMTSRFEGYANTLVEAISCGIPSISYNWLVGVDDIISNGENGLIVKLNDRFAYFNGKNFNTDIENLSKAILSLIENPKLRSNISSNGLKIYNNRNKEYIIKKWRDIIDEKN